MQSYIDMAKAAGATDPKLLGEGGTAIVYTSDGLVYKVYDLLENACADFLCYTQLWDHFPRVRKYLPRIYGVDNNVVIKDFVEGTIYDENDMPGPLSSTMKKKNRAISQVKKSALELGWDVFDFSYANRVWTGDQWVIIDFYAEPITEETQKQVMDCMLSARH